MISNKPTSPDAMIAQAKEAKQTQLCLGAHDCHLLLNTALTLATLQVRLSHNDLTVATLKKPLGIVRSSEQTKNLLPSDGQSDGAMIV